MNRSEIEREVRRLQVEIYTQRAIIWPMGEPPMEAMFDPMNVADFLQLNYEIRDHIGAERGGAGEYAAAGTLDRRRNTIAISSRFDYPIQRFTAAHEIGHFILHPKVGIEVAHRDRPVFGIQGSGRPQVEREADYFAACLLVPLKLLQKQFELRFGTKKPLPLNDVVAFHLTGGSTHLLLEGGTNPYAFALALAKAQSFDRGRFPSLAQHFGVSVSAMAIRICEAGLVEG